VAVTSCRLLVSGFRIPETGNRKPAATKTDKPYHIPTLNAALKIPGHKFG
jgi:hypothetical protein